MGASLFEFDAVEERWRGRSEMPAALQPIVAADDRRLYALGGWDGAGSTHAVYAYDPEADRWKPGPPLAFPDSVAVLEEGRILLFGDYYDRDLVGVYSLGDGKSALLPVEAPSHRQLAAVKTGPWVHLIGGGPGMLRPSREVVSYRLSALHAVADQALRAEAPPP